MSIHLVTGPPGSGKSYFCVRTALDALETGKWLATNVELHDGWHEELARANQLRRMIPGRRRKFAAQFLERTFVSHSLDELTRLRLPPCGSCSACNRGYRCMKEGRGIMLLDEAHNWLNARTWDADEGGKALSKQEAIANRLKIVRFFSQHRKLGWTVYLVTQDAAQLDAQVRRNFEYHVHLRNFKSFRVLGMPIFPFHVFSAITTWFDAQESKVGAKVYRLNKRVANLYDTTATSHGLDWDADDAIWLGDHGDRKPKTPHLERQVTEQRRATAEEIAAVTSWANGLPNLRLQCPHCASALPYTGSGAGGETIAPQSAAMPGTPAAVIRLRCPGCGKSAPLRAPTRAPNVSKVILPPGVSGGAASETKSAAAPAHPIVSPPNAKRVVGLGESLDRITTAARTAVDARQGETPAFHFPTPHRRRAAQATDLSEVTASMAAVEVPQDNETASAPTLTVSPQHLRDGAARDGKSCRES